MVMGGSGRILEWLLAEIFPYAASARLFPRWCGKWWRVPVAMHDGIVPDQEFPFRDISNKKAYVGPDMRGWRGDDGPFWGCWGFQGLGY
jgi:hypothetical protein